MNRKEAFFTLTYGLYLVSSSDGKKSNAYIANTVFQVSSRPARLAISCHKENLSAGLIDQGGAFGVSVLQKDTPLEFIQRNGYQTGREQDKFMHLNYKKGITGIPVIYDYSLAWFECRVEQKTDVATHWLFIGEVVDYGLLSSYEEPLDYAWYRKTYKAVSPQKAPTFVSEEDSETGKITGEGLASYACAVCEYIYHPGKGDPARGIPPGTAFDDLPDDWVCPVCGAGKMVFAETSADY